MFVLKNASLKNVNGFTLIELMITVLIVGIMAGVSLSVINVTRQKAIANDAVYSGTLNKLMLSLESYNAGEGSYPPETGVGADGRLTTTVAPVSTYLSSWPSVATSYFGTGNTMCVSIPMATTPTKFFKYVDNSIASGGVGSCIGKIMRDCDFGCSFVAPATINGRNRTGCTNLSKQACE